MTRDKAPAIGSDGERKFLTPEEVSGRYRGEISVGTLRNWRAMRRGPAFLRVGKAILYPTDALDAWDRRNLVPCDPAMPDKDNSEG
jgi:hypothetical protein